MILADLILIHTHIHSQPQRTRRMSRSRSSSTSSDGDPPEITLDALSADTLAALNAHLAVKGATEVTRRLVVVGSSRLVYIWPDP